ncbi:ion transporter [Levilactobacillus bambusae]|uniref:Ion transporter n=2 Tax=Levilactobacillus bambusae TaxID=2024736 RepID=A0A2V1MX32_9LACO|nr:ion transporter [Levilactobacillus bambusae]
MKNSALRSTYDMFIITLAIISTGLTLYEFAEQIPLNTAPFDTIDNLIWAVFTIDYFGGLWLAKNKRQYVKTHVLDLLAIIPVNYLFSLFRFARVIRLVRIARLIRLAGVIVKIREKLYSFLKTNGFLYLMYASIVIILLASAFFSMAENISFGEAIWWALTTATTVGYGDVAPHTHAGKVIAIFLMLVGVGFVGMLTSTLTTFFAANQQDSQQLNRVQNEIAQLHKENHQLQQKLDHLSDQLQNSAQKKPRD